MRNIADELVGTTRAAELLDVNVATVNRWAVEGALVVAVKAPGRRGANLFRRRDIEALAAKRKGSAA